MTGARNYVFGGSVFISSEVAKSPWELKAAQIPSQGVLLRVNLSQQIP
jgi:hypothetical protein